MIDKKFFSKLHDITLNYAEKRRELIKLSGDAEQRAKKAIFALHRNDFKQANALLKESLGIFDAARKVIKNDERLSGEGSFRAAQEEYAEAYIFKQSIVEGKVANILSIKIDADIYLAGLCDVPGELYRYAIKSATEKNFDKVKLCHDISEEIIVELVDMNLTGYNRQKFDQAKQALHKLEQVIYEVSLKNS